MDGQSLVQPSGDWPYLAVLMRVALAIGLGLFVGLERERRHKEAGVRTFAFATAIGCIGGLLGDNFALAGLALLIPFVIFLNIHSLGKEGDIEMTTSAALIVMGFVGILCGKGHTFTPVALGLLTAGLLAWKTPLSGFSIGITESELRAAILLGILAFVVYPVLPNGAVDPWGLIMPRAIWTTVILIAALGFVNYVLLKIYGPRGVLAAAFLAGLVNSTVAVTELAARTQRNHALGPVAYRGTMLATGAMLIRNGVLLGILAPQSIRFAAIPLGAMLLACAGLAFRPSHGPPGPASDPGIQLDSPFSLQQALKFGLLFLILAMLGTLGQRALGEGGFYAVSALGGIVSSASAVGSAGQLAMQGTIGAFPAAVGAILATIASALVNVPLLWRISQDRPLGRSAAWSMGFIALMGAIGIAVASVS